MRGRGLAALALACALSLAGCAGATFSARLNVRFEGDLATYDLNPGGGAFTQVSLRDLEPSVRAALGESGRKLRIVYEQGEGYEAWLEAPEDMFGHVAATLRGSALTVSGERDITYDFDEATLYLRAPTLARLSAEGMTEFTTIGPLEADKFEAVFSGVAEFDADIRAYKIALTVNGASAGAVSGGADRFEVELNGAGELDASGLIAQECEARVNGAGQLKVYAEGSLSAHIAGAAEIVYYGNPKVSRTIAGIGSVRAGE